MYASSFRLSLVSTKISFASSNGSFKIKGVEGRMDKNLLIQQYLGGTSLKETMNLHLVCLFCLI